jgi:hypothetical protein
LIKESGKATKRKAARSKLKKCRREQSKMKSYNWQLDLEKLYKAYERACDDNDTTKQESISEEIRQIEEIIQAK